MEDVHYGTDPLHQPLIAIPKLLKRLGLASEDSFDSIDRVALLHLSRERMVEKILPSLSLVLAQGLAQGSIKNRSEVRGNLAGCGRRHGLWVITSQITRGVLSGQYLDMFGTQIRLPDRASTFMDTLRL